MATSAESRWRALAWQLPAALLLPAAASLLCGWLDAQVTAAAKALVYLLAVMAAAAWLPRWAGVLVSLLSVSALDFLFVPPRHAFAFSGLEYTFTLLVLLLVSLSLNALVASLRRARAVAERREAQARQRHALDQRLATAEGIAGLADAAAAWWRETFARPAALYLRGGDGTWTLHGDAAIEGDPAGAAAWATQQRRALGRGLPDWPDLPLWCMPLHATLPVGAIVGALGEGETPDLETLAHWRALAAQIGQRIEHEQMQVSARQAQSQAKAEAVRNAVLASLSHDLRTPLTGILGTAGLLREQGDALVPAQRAQLLCNLEDEARDLTRMADNVLQTARLSQPQWQLRTQWESVEDLLGATMQRIRRRWPQAVVQARVAPDLPPLRVEAGLIVQVLLNLVDNALRHGGADAHVEIAATRDIDGVRLGVADDGAGLPPGDPQQLFVARRDVRFDAGGRDSAGLGLSLCRRIVEAHGGSIRASRRARGSEFVVELPAAPVAEADA